MGVWLERSEGAVWSGARVGACCVRASEWGRKLFEARSEARAILSVLLRCLAFLPAAATAGRGQFEMRLARRYGRDASRFSNALWRSLQQG